MKKQRKEDPHSAIWGTYVMRETKEPVPANNTPIFGRQPGASNSKKKQEPQILRFLKLLARKHSPIPRPLGGIGLWNLIRNQYPIGDLDSEPLSSIPSKLTDLLDQVLDLDALRDPYRVGAMRTNRRYEVFPPYPDRVILDSRYVEHPQPRGAKARLEICVPTDNEQIVSFDSLRQIIDPRTWDACSLFWSEIKMAHPLPNAKASPQSATAQLTLPEGSPPSKRVQLNIVQFSDRNPMRAHMQFTIKKNALLDFCQGSVTVQKEPGCPGAVRVINIRAVQFAQSRLRDHAYEILRYWLQAETACLVLRG